MCGPGPEMFETDDLTESGSMSENELTKEQQRELQSIADSMTMEAGDVVKDYNKHLSDLDSGSIVQIHEGSPYVATKKERLKFMEGLDGEEKQ
jgi:hypothetical protein